MDLKEITHDILEKNVYSHQDFEKLFLEILHDGVQYIITPKNAEPKIMPKLFTEFIVDLAKVSSDLKLRYDATDFEKWFKISSIKNNLTASDDGNFKPFGVPSEELYFSLKNNMIDKLAPKALEVLYLMYNYLKQTDKIQKALMNAYTARVDIPFRFKFDFNEKTFVIPKTVKDTYLKVYQNRKTYDYMNDLDRQFRKFLTGLNLKYIVSR